MLRYKFKRINEQTISENFLLYWRIRRLLTAAFVFEGERMTGGTANERMDPLCSPSTYSTEDALNLSSTALPLSCLSFPSASIFTAPFSASIRSQGGKRGKEKVSPSLFTS